MHVNVAPQGQPVVYENIPLEHSALCPKLTGFRGYSIQNQSILVRAFYGLQNFFHKTHSGCISHNDAFEGPRGPQSLRAIPMNPGSALRFNLQHSGASRGQESRASSGSPHLPHSSLSQRAPNTELEGSTSAGPALTVLLENLSSGRAPTTQPEDLSTGRAPTTQMEDLSTRRVHTIHLEGLSSGRASTARLGSSSSSMTMGQGRQCGRNRRRVLLDFSSSHQGRGQEVNLPPNHSPVIELSSDEEEAQSRRRDKSVMDQTPHHYSGEPSIFYYIRGSLLVFIIIKGSPPLLIASSVNPPLLSIIGVNPLPLTGIRVNPLALGRELPLTFLDPHQDKLRRLLVCALAADGWASHRLPLLPRDLDVRRGTH